MSKIYLAYSNDNKPLAERVKASLKTLNHEVNDHTTMSVGPGAIESLRNTVNEADGVIILLGEHQPPDDFSSLEIGVALTNPGIENKRIMLMGSDDVKPVRYLAG